MTPRMRIGAFSGRYSAALPEPASGSQRTGSPRSKATSASAGSMRKFAGAVSPTERKPVLTSWSSTSPSAFMTLRRKTRVISATCAIVRAPDSSRAIS